jgi:hypothetical protein
MKMGQLTDEHSDPSPDSVTRGHEPDPLRVRLLVWSLVGFIGFAVVAHVGIWYVMKHDTDQPRYVDRRRSVARPDPGPPAGAPPLQPTPRHDVVPWQDVAELRAAEDRVFGEMGWRVENGRAVIPDSIVRAVAARTATRPAGLGGGDK